MCETFCGVKEISVTATELQNTNIMYNCRGHQVAKKKMLKKSCPVSFNQRPPFLVPKLLMAELLFLVVQLT